MAQKHRKGTNNSGLFPSGLALCQGEADVPEHSLMQADWNVDCLYSEAQDLCTNLDGAKQEEMQ